LIQVDKTEKLKYREELLASYQGSKIERERLEAFELEKYYKVREMVSIEIHLLRLYLYR